MAIAVSAFSVIQAAEFVAVLPPVEAFKSVFIKSVTCRLNLRHLWQVKSCVYSQTSKLPGKAASSAGMKPSSTRVLKRGGVQASSSYC